MGLPASASKDPAVVIGCVALSAARSSAISASIAATRGSSGSGCGGASVGTYPGPTSMAYVYHWVLSCLLRAVPGD